MKINELSLENFKCFDNIDLKFSKLTLLTGANSSGKSSIIYSILSPFQSGEFPLQFSTNGKYVNMGDFEDISYSHLKNNIIKIGFNIDTSEAPTEKNLVIDTFWKYDKQRKLPILHKLTCTEDYFNLSIYHNLKNQLTLEFEYFKENDTLNRIGSLEFQRKLDSLINERLPGSKSNKPSNYFKLVEKRFKLNNKKIKISIAENENISTAIEDRGSYALQIIFSKILKTFKQLDSKSNYISSFRFHPQKIRNEITKADLRIGKYGDNYEDQILLWETNKDPKFKELVATLKKQSLLQDIKMDRHSGANYELKIKTHRAGVYSSLTDVGFGISQFLPILVSDLQLGKNSTLFISQPEIHLHPRMQSEFGEYLYEQIKSHNKNYVIETHSEYLINRIRLLIVQKKLSPDDVKIYYFNKVGNKSEKHELEFTTNGEIKNAPRDFFDTYMTDVMNIAFQS